VVLSLGTPEIPVEDRPVIAKAVERQLYGRRELLPPQYSPSVQTWIDTIIRRIDRQGRWSPISRRRPPTRPAPRPRWWTVCW